MILDAAGRPLREALPNAIVVPHAAACLDEAAVRAHARERLASKVQRGVLFFAEDALRPTENAKIKSTNLRALATARLAAERPGRTTIEREDER